VTAVTDTYLPVDVEDRTAPAPRVQVEATGGDVMAIETAELAWRDQVELEATTRARRENIRRAIEDIRRAIQVRFGHVARPIEEVIDNAASDVEHVTPSASRRRATSTQER